MTEYRAKRQRWYPQPLRFNVPSIFVHTVTEEHWKYVWEYDGDGEMQSAESFGVYSSARQAQSAARQQFKELGESVDVEEGWHDDEDEPRSNGNGDLDLTVHYGDDDTTYFKVRAEALM